MMNGRFLALSAILLSAFSSALVRADLTAPPVDFTLEQTARLITAKYDLIVEGTVATVTPTPRVLGERCMWVTELMISDVSAIKGVVGDGAIRVFTLSLPSDLPPSPPGGCTITIAEDSPPPQPGENGIFLLKLHPVYGLMLQTVSYSFVVRKKGDLVTIDQRGPKTWSYAAFINELIRQVNASGADRTIKESELILLVRPRPSNELVTQREDGIRWLQWPVDVEKVYRGSMTVGTYFIRYSPDDFQEPSDAVESLTRGILGRLLSLRLQSVQGVPILFLGNSGIGTSLVPSNLCFVPFDENRNLKLPQLQIADGRVDWQRVSIEAIEEDLAR